MSIQHIWKGEGQLFPQSIDQPRVAREVDEKVHQLTCGKETWVELDFSCPKSLGPIERLAMSFSSGSRRLASAAHIIGSSLSHLAAGMAAYLLPRKEVIQPLQMEELPPDWDLPPLPEDGLGSTWEVDVYHGDFSQPQSPLPTSRSSSPAVMTEEW